MKFEDYLIDGTNVLKNKFNITNIRELVEKEKEVSLYRLANLFINDIKFEPSAKYLVDLHGYLFQDIYEFAGKYRLINMFREHSSFLDYQEIPKVLEETINKYNNMNIDINNQFSIARLLGEFYRELIYIHPFREGNGRVIREFLREFSIYKFNLDIDYSKIDRKNFLLGITEADTYPLLLAFEINNSLVENEVLQK